MENNRLEKDKKEERMSKEDKFSRHPTRTTETPTIALLHQQGR
jgi:hypothetical protein